MCLLEVVNKTNKTSKNLKIFYAVVFVVTAAVGLRVRLLLQGCAIFRKGQNISASENLPGKAASFWDL